MKSSYEVRAQKFIKIFAPYAIKCLMSRNIIDIRNVVSKFNQLHHRSVKVYRGYTRIVFVTSDYVIKVDYNPDKHFGDSFRELELYKCAAADGYDYLFAKITLFQYEHINFFIMPMVKGINKNNGEAWNYMSIEERAWCMKYQLDDLHEMNFGINRNGDITIFDYATCQINYDKDCE